MRSKHQRFIAEYLKDLNATQAALRAGYSKKTAHVQGCVLLKNPKVKAALAIKTANLAAKHEISAERVLQELAMLAFSNMQDYITVSENGEAYTDLSKLSRDQAAAIQEIKVDETGGGAGDGRRERVQRTTFKLADKGINLERLGRHLKLFTDKVEVTGLDSIAEELEKARKRAKSA